MTAFVRPYAGLTDIIGIAQLVLLSSVDDRQNSVVRSPVEAHAHIQKLLNQDATPARLCAVSLNAIWHTVVVHSQTVMPRADCARHARVRIWERYDDK